MLSRLAVSSWLGSKLARWTLCARNIKSAKGRSYSACASSRVQSWRGSTDPLTTEKDDTFKADPACRGAGRRPATLIGTKGGPCGLRGVNTPQARRMLDGLHARQHTQDM